MKNIKYFSSLIVILAFLACKSDEAYFGDEIYNTKSVFPYVAIHDYNEDLDSLGGQNNYWSFILTPENNGNQVRVQYSTQDDNIIYHNIIVGLNDSETPPPDGVVLKTLNTFPIDVVITIEEVAEALGMSVDELNTYPAIIFGGKSEDKDGNIVESTESFENFIFWERHAYYYEWPLN